MKALSRLTIAVAVIAVPLAVQAADVSLEGTHLCCKRCVTTVASTLKKVEGVTDASCNQDKHTVTFKAADKKTATKALRALVRAGFYGTAKVDGKAVKLPTQKIKAGTKTASASLRGAHLCCGSCDSAAKKAINSVKGVSDITIDRKKRTISVTGTDIDVAALVAALNKAGFSSRYAKPKK
jgi:copper chaperone CopZ